MSTDDVIASLNEAKQRLDAAKTSGLRAASLVAQAKDGIHAALGRDAQHSDLFSAVAAKDKALIAKVMRIDGLKQQIDQAIADTRKIGDTGRGSASSSEGGSAGEAGGSGGT